MEEYSGDEEAEFREQDEVQEVTEVTENSKRTGGESKRARKGGVEPKFPAMSPAKGEQEQKPRGTTFAEIFWRTRPASWSPGSGTKKEEKVHRKKLEETDMGTTPVKEKIRRLEEKSRNIRTPANKKTDRRKKPELIPGQAKILKYLERVKPAQSLQGTTVPETGNSNKGVNNDSLLGDTGQGSTQPPSSGGTTLYLR